MSFLRGGLAGATLDRLPARRFIRKGRCGSTARARMRRSARRPDHPDRMMRRARPGGEHPEDGDDEPFDPRDGSSRAARTRAHRAPARAADPAARQGPGGLQLDPATPGSVASRDHRRRDGPVEHFVKSVLDVGRRALVRFLELEGFDRAMALAGQAFAALLPLLIVWARSRRGAARISPTA